MPSDQPLRLPNADAAFCRQGSLMAQVCILSISLSTREFSWENPVYLIDVAFAAHLLFVYLCCLLGSCSQVLNHDLSLDSIVLGASAWVSRASPQCSSPFPATQQRRSRVEPSPCWALLHQVLVHF